MKNYSIDIKEKSLGRAASEAAVILIGKNSADFEKNQAPNVKVEILNIEDIKITGKKLGQKDYKKYSGYPGGLKIEKMEKVIDKKGKSFIFEKAVRGMLPKNKLRKIMMKNLVIK